MSPVGLENILEGLSHSADPNLLVGFASNDDAGVYRLRPDLALVSTADFITPPVDDPFIFGQIGAANALSDIYAMGAKPLTCLNLAGFPANVLGPEVLRGILEGALSKITEAGAVLAGGHTTDDDEPKFGLAVTGTVHPDKIWRNIGAQPGDALLLTKPIGSGVLFNANLKKWVSAEAMEACIATITTLNRVAAETLADFSVHAATDVTGFGLAGHALEMARGSGVSLEISHAQVPIMDQALAMYERGMTTGVNQANSANIEGMVDFAVDLPKLQREIYLDPQTSGGLLVALPQSQSDQALAALRAAGVSQTQRIGSVLAHTPPHYLVFK